MEFFTANKSNFLTSGIVFKIRLKDNIIILFINILPDISELQVFFARNKIDQIIALDVMHYLPPTLNYYDYDYDIY